MIFLPYFKRNEPGSKTQIYRISKIADFSGNIISKNNNIFYKNCIEAFYLNVRIRLQVNK